MNKITVIIGFLVVGMLAGVGFMGKLAPIVQARDGVALCQSLGVRDNKTNVGVGEQIIFSATANTTVSKFMFAFFNRDNSNTLIKHNGSDYAPTFEKSSNEHTQGFNYADLALPDSNTGKVTSNIQVNAYFFNAAGVQSWGDPACSVGFTVTPPPLPPTAALAETSRPVRVGEGLTFHANLTGGSDNGAIYVTKGDGSADFYCPGEMQNVGYPEKGLWCKLPGSGSGTSIQGDYRFLEKGIFTVVVNGYKGNYAGTASTGCSGNPLPYGITVKQNGQWSDCGSNDNITITALANDPVQCTLISSSSLVRGSGSITFKAYASALEGQNDPRVKRIQLWYTYPALQTPQPASPPLITWYPLGNMNTNACKPDGNNPCTATIDTSTLPVGATSLTVQCSAYMVDANNPLASTPDAKPGTLPENACTGMPWAVGATVDSPWTSTPNGGNPAGGVKWSSCGAKSFANISVVTSCLDTGDFTGKGPHNQENFTVWKNAFLNTLRGLPATISNCPGMTVDLKAFNVWRRKDLGL